MNTLTIYGASDDLLEVDGPGGDEFGGKADLSRGRIDVSTLESRIADVLREHGWTCEYHEPVSRRGECSGCDTSHERTAKAIATVVQPTITTLCELKALKPRPDLIVGVLIRAQGVPAFGAVYELNDDGTWNNFDALNPSEQRTAPEDVPLPAVVLWTPGDDQ